MKFWFIRNSLSLSDAGVVAQCHFQLFCSLEMLLVTNTINFFETALFFNIVELQSLRDTRNGGVLS
ncbi:MAG: hypothetical protein ACKO96_38710, partial [Flammeovirgaceae bacterium]